MSGYPYGGNPPQYPPPQNQIYPQIYNPANAPPPGQPGQPASFPMPGQNPQYPFQPGFGYYPGQPQVGQPGQPGQPGHPGGYPAAMSYPGIAPTAPLPSAPAYGYPTYAPHQQPQPTVTPAVEWIPTTPQHAPSLSDRAVVAGYEGYDGSPLWVIRARFQGDLVPGKLAAKHHCAFIPWDGRENAVNEIEVCCARPERIRWTESRDGVIPPNAIPAGHTAAGEPLYVGRAKEQGSLTPGKVHPSHKAMYMSFAGKEVPHKVYEVLCTV